MVLFSIITDLSSRPGKAAVMTGHSVQVQREAPAFEWLIVGGALSPEAAEECASLQPVLCDDVNAALKRATGEYVWFLPAGDCLSDAYVLRDLRRDLAMQVMPDFFYGVPRENGRIKTPRAFSSFACGMIAPLQAMLFRRRVIGELRFDAADGKAAAYAFVLRFIDNAEKIAATNRLVTDIVSPSQTKEEKSAARADRFRVRERLLKQTPWKNKGIDRIDALTDVFQSRMPRLYGFMRDIVLPTPRNRKPSPVQSKYRGIFFKKR